MDVNTILEEAIALLQVQFKGYITWRTSLGRNLPRINASADKLKQVFLNLFLNAREAMDQPGEIRVVTRLSRVADAEYLPGKYVLIEISDTGTGISEENLTRIFDPFFSTKRERRGTGLGLWVSQDIVHQHGGQIKVRSQPGHGSTFTVALPIGGENEQISQAARRR